MKIALITGASSGIGKELSRLYARKNYSLVLFGQNEEALQALQQELQVIAEVAIIQANLSLPDGQEKLQAAIESFVPDHVINCAGTGIYGNAVDEPLCDELSIVEVNVTALVLA